MLQSHGDDDSDEGGHSTFSGGVKHLHGQWALNGNVLPVGDVRYVKKHQVLELRNCGVS